MDDEIRWREKTEWQNIWWEQANDIKVERIALLGDSVTRGFRKNLNERMKGKYVVDLCASSSQITDPLLWKEYKFFLDCGEWNYNKIILQAGGQHGHVRECSKNENYLKLFKSSYRELIEKILEYCPDILIVSFTPCVERENLVKWDDEKNKEIEKRNQITEEIANDFNIPYINIWGQLLDAKYEFKDSIHMREDGNNFIAEYLSKFLL